MRNISEKFINKDSMYENKEEILNLNSYLELIDDLRHLWKNRKLWYRGVSRSEFDLVPTIYRDRSWNYTMGKENRLIKDYKRNSYPHLKQSNFSIWELYELMQHYGSPTRLLDWSQGSLIALLFALINVKDCQTPAVWVLDPYFLNFKTCNAFVVFYSMYSEDPRDISIIDQYLNLSNTGELPDYPVAVLPPLIDKRIVAQKSCFTIHGKKINGFEEMTEKFEDLRLVKLKIPDRAIEYIKYELLTTGITNTTIYPDLEGLAKDLKYNHSIK